ncbi:mitochondrial ribosomal protein S11 [Augochlora pura]
MNSPTLSLAACSLIKKHIISFGNISRKSCLNLTGGRCIHSSSADLKEVRMDSTKVRVKDDSKHSSLEGESSRLINSSINKLFPDDNTPKELFNGIMFKDLPIINVKATPNNTILTLTDSKGLVQAIHSAGIEGFKNAKKGTNIAGQQAANTFGLKTVRAGTKTVRLTLQGIGPGRMAAIKGLELAGITIISITDTTRVSWNPPRPKKQRRI